jgi:ferrochelatase
MAPDHTAVLLMAYGSPNGFDEVEPYFTDIRGGKAPSREALRELTEKYRRVGVPTPLLSVSLQLGRELERLLNADSNDGDTYAVQVGMKHWTPRIKSVIEEIVASDASRIVAIVLAPHYSRISTGGYRRQVDAALSTASRPIALDFVESWHDLDGYVEAVADNVRAVRARFRDPEKVVTIFTAHSLPARILAEGDPYRNQLLHTSELIAQRVGLSEWRFSFQSQSQTGEPWLGPDLVETIQSLARDWHHQILVASIGFVADNLEILYDIDIEAKGAAETLGVDLRRTPMLNADPRLAAALRALVLARVAALR